MTTTVIEPNGDGTRSTVFAACGASVQEDGGLWILHGSTIVAEYDADGWLSVEVANT